MYSYLSGTIHSIEDTTITLLISGTGLGVEILLSPLALTGVTIGDEIAFPIYHHKTEVSEVLFGFRDREEKSLFQKLLRVNGVGGKTALSILGLGSETIYRAIEKQDDALLSTVPGIGKKTAQKILLDLKGSVDLSTFSSGGGKTVTQTTPTPSLLRSSLIQMGYDRARVETVISSIDSTLPIAEQTKLSIMMLSTH